MSEETTDTVVPTLSQKQQLVEHTFPNIYREVTTVPAETYTHDEWVRMIDVLYEKAKNVVEGSIAPIVVGKVRW